MCKGLSLIPRAAINKYTTTTKQKKNKKPQNLTVIRTERGRNLFPKTLIPHNA
jgi:hypothetical protein